MVISAMSLSSPRRWGGERGEGFIGATVDGCSKLQPKFFNQPALQFQIESSECLNMTVAKLQNLNWILTVRCSNCDWLSPHALMRGELISRRSQERCSETTPKIFRICSGLLNSVLRS